MSQTSEVSDAFQPDAVASNGATPWADGVTHLASVGVREAGTRYEADLSMQEAPSVEPRAVLEPTIGTTKVGIA